MKENERSLQVRPCIIMYGIDEINDVLTAYLDEFEDECMTFEGIKWHTYLTDMLCDGYDLSTEVMKSRNEVLSNRLISRINQWYRACNDLTFDFKIWLKDTYNITLSEITERVMKRQNGGK